MASLDTLSLTASEISGDQLDSVDGGIVPVIIVGLAAFDVGLWTYILTH